ncbi:MAG: phosphatidylglycerophosphatase A [Elusimicrobiota bacterium]
MRVVDFIASGFYISKIPSYFSKRESKFRGCGLFGTLLAFILLPLTPEKNNLLFLIVFTLFAIYISHNAFILSGEKDNPLIVIDEICGYWWCFLFFEKNIINAISLFVFFRIFDTIKPWPIKKLENINFRGFSIVIDDIVAGLYASFVMFLSLCFLV